MWINQWLCRRPFVFVGVASACGFFGLTSANPAKPLEITICCPGKELTRLDAMTETGSVITLPSLKTSQSVDTIAANALKQRQASRVESVIDSTALLPSSHQAGYATAIGARGFHTEGEVFINGHRDNQQFYTRDLHTVDQVDVLKGHSSVLYGSGSPGATLNYRSKRPLPMADTHLGLLWGNRDFLRGTLDSTGPLNRQHALSYRLTAASEDGDTLYDQVPNRHWVIAPSLQWQYADHGRLRLETEYAHNQRPYHFGTVYAQGRLFYDQSYVFPQAKADKRYDRTSLYWSHYFSAKNQWDISLHGYRTRRDDLHVGFFNKRDEDTLNGYYRAVHNNYRQHNLKATWLSQFKTGAFNHQLQLGLETNDSHDDIKSWRNIGDFLLDIEQPDFSIDLTQLPLTPRFYRWENREHALFIFDHLQISPKWRLDLGSRYSRADTIFKMGDETTRLSETDLFSNFIGIQFQANQQTAYHWHLSESFQPNRGRDRHGHFFDPKIARQIEAGIKYQPSTVLSAVELTFYQLSQQNLTTEDPVDPDFNVLTGEQRSRGIELGLDFKINAQLAGKLDYAWTQATITQNNDGLKGNTPASVPAHAAAMQLRYQPSSLPGLTLWSQANAFSARFGDDDNRFKVPGYTRLDIGASHQNGALTTRFILTNALDKRYITAAFADDDIYQGERLQGKLSFEYAF